MSIKIIIIMVTVVLFFVPSFVFGTLTDKDLEELYGNINRTELVYENSTIVLEQNIPKTMYKLGETVTVTPYLVNNGTQNVTVYYLPDSIGSFVKDENGNYLPQSSGAVGSFMENTPILKQTLLPNVPNSLDISSFQFVPAKPPKTNFPTMFLPGNYTITSLAWIRFDLNKSDSFIGMSLWSKPIQITVLPEKYEQGETGSMSKIPEFQFAMPVFLTSIASLIFFYRIKFR